MLRVYRTPRPPLRECGREQVECQASIDTLFPQLHPPVSSSPIWLSKRAQPNGKRLLSLQLIARSILLRVCEQAPLVLSEVGWIYCGLLSIKARKLDDCGTVKQVDGLYNFISAILSEPNERLFTRHSHTEDQLSSLIIVSGNKIQIFTFCLKLQTKLWRLELRAAAIGSTCCAVIFSARLTKSQGADAQLNSHAWFWILTSISLVCVCVKVAPDFVLLCSLGKRIFVEKTSLARSL